MVQPPRRCGVHGSGCRRRGLRVLARSQLQRPRRGAREARRTVPGRRRPPERPDDGRAAVRQHPTGTPEPPLGAPRPLAVPLVDGHQGRGAHEGHEVAGAEGQEDGRRLPGESAEVRRQEARRGNEVLVPGDARRPGRERVVEDHRDAADGGDLRSGRRSGGGRASRRPVGAGGQGALLQPPALAREPQAAHDVGARSRSLRCRCTGR